MRDPRGMFGERLGVNMHIVTAAAAAARNLPNCVGRCHLETAALVVSPYASGLACSSRMRKDLGVTVLDMGGGTTTIGVFFDGNLVYADGPGRRYPCHQRYRARPLDSARACRTHEDALWQCHRRPVDERETITVAADWRGGLASQSRRRNRCSSASSRRGFEETFELVRERLEASGFDKLAGRRVVLTGGACQLTACASWPGSSSTSRFASAGGAHQGSRRIDRAGRPFPPPPGSCLRYVGRGRIRRTPALAGRGTACSAAWAVAA